MKTRECPACAMEVDSNSKTCPICQYEFTRTAPALKVVAWILVLCLLMYFLIR